MNAAYFKNLGSFLADHFGGYPDIETASQDCGYSSYDEYLEAFCHDLGEPHDLIEAEKFLSEQRVAGNEPWQPMREKFFDDCGNVLKGATVPKALRLIIEQNN